MDLQEIEEKVDQYCKLWVLYTDASYELARKSKSSPMEVAKACKIYEPYIRDILQQVDIVMTIFAMEKELRNLKGKGHFPIPKITPHGIIIDNPQHARKTLDTVDEELVQILNIIRESERKYEKRGSQTQRTTGKSKQTSTKARIQLSQPELQHTDQEHRHCHR